MLKYLRMAVHIALLITIGLTISHLIDVPYFETTDYILTMFLLNVLLQCIPKEKNGENRKE